MKFRYCPDCGALLSGRVLGDEGLVPWCERCGKPWFDMFPSAVIGLVYNCRNDVLLLRQNYISTQFCNLVSGYMKPGEDAESCMVREIKEETGLTVDLLEPVCTNWFAKKDMLMIGFFARVKDDDGLPGGCHAPLTLSTEVDGAEWHRPEEIVPLVRQKPTSTSRILALRFLDRLADERK